MPRPLKQWIGWDIARASDDARRRDGRDARQVDIAVRATSKRRAAELLGVTVGHLSTYFGEPGPGSAVSAALDAFPPETVIVAPMDPGSTVLGGKQGWHPRPPR